MTALPPMQIRRKPTTVSDRLREWRIWTGSLEHVSTVTVNDDYERVTFRTRDPEPEKLFVRLRIGTPR